jgi:CDP-diacylglycerol--glycerol-3-phosphate 3-phosphatidyltransferase
MITTAELTYTLTLALIVLLLAAAYGFRLAVKGRAHFDRIDRQGGSRLLSKGAMELGYWILDPVAKLLVWIRVTPNEVSWTSLGFGFLAAACLAVGHFGFGAIFATISGLLDSVDGMVARMSGVASDAGEILDAVVDRYVEFFFLSALVIYYREILILQAAALLALLGSFMVTYSTSKAEALGLTPPRGSMRRPERAVYLTLGAALSTVSIPLFEPPAESSNPIGYPMVVALVLVAVAANVSSIRRFWSIAKAVRVREKDFVGGKSSSEKFSIEEHEAAATSHDATGVRL